MPLNILTPKLTLKTAKDLVLYTICICLQKFYLKMHKYCLKITNVIPVMTSWLYSNHIGLLQMQNIGKHGSLYSLPCIPHHSMWTGTESESVCADWLVPIWQGHLCNRAWTPCGVQRLKLVCTDFIL